MHAFLPSPARCLLVAAALWSCLPVVRADATSPETEQRYLSGHGPADAVPWEFSVTGGRRAGEPTMIPVPSNWEQHGFGAYNYGEETPAFRASEHGLYRLRFRVPDAWQNRRVRLVFEGVMTDASVKVNGQTAGPVHQGGFYRFRYDITALLKPGGGENLLEVDVAKVSANPATEAAERTGDYWVFGGIYRPVYLEAVPLQAIASTAIDARADGSLTARVTLGSVSDADLVEAQVCTADNQPVGTPFTAPIAAGSGGVTLSAHLETPRLWTAETPELYTLRLSLRRGSEVLHTVTDRFGFRTFETRAGQGLFLNGQRILLKGVGRHSFRPETARALDRQDCYDDVRLIKEMNMNAVRMTHYPPDAAFLDACDELGLYVLDELSGWHHAHDTDNGRVLVREMVTRDVNHPSILFWDNGNEGGWNPALDREFAVHDPQHRSVLHPWTLLNGVDTKHYPIYDDLKKRLAGPNLVMPTEMIHGLYDGGAGAGLEDYWDALAGSPYGGGGFIWVFADEGLVRTDQHGRVDVYSTYAPDGILGPHHEKEGSFYTVRDVWSPVQIDAPAPGDGFDGKLTVHNRYDFTPLDRVGFRWRLLRFPAPADKETAPRLLSEGRATSPAIAPHESGPLSLDLPANWREADALALTATDPAQREIWTWTWPTPSLEQPRVAAVPPAHSAPAPEVETSGGEVRLHGGNLTASFDAASGLLRSVRRGGAVCALTNGPRLAFARPSAAGDPIPSLDASPVPPTDPGGAITWNLPAPQLANLLEIALDYPHGINWAGFRLEISPDGQRWKTLFDSSRRPHDGNGYEFPPQRVAAVRLSHFRRSDGNPAQVKSLRVGYQSARFPDDSAAPPVVTSGAGVDPQSHQPTAWLESAGAAGLDRFRWTLSADGGLRLDYRYHLDGDFLYHGITFDHPESALETLRWLGDGPYRVWQNRLRGPSLGVHETTRNDIQPGEVWNYPEFQGYFSGLRWARLGTAAGPLTIEGVSPGTYLRVGTPRISFPTTTAAFPAGDVSFLRAIPAMGSKFVPAQKTGPASQPAKASGEVAGTLTFHFGD